MVVRVVSLVSGINQSYYFRPMNWMLRFQFVDGVYEYLSIWFRKLLSMLCPYYKVMSHFAMNRRNRCLCCKEALATDQIKMVVSVLDNIYIYMSFRIVYTIPQLWKLISCKRGVGENMVWELSHGVLFWSDFQMVYKTSHAYSINETLNDWFVEKKVMEYKKDYFLSLDFESNYLFKPKVALSNWFPLF